jgi:peptide/nickel transport system substrate-binding protein
MRVDDKQIALTESLVAHFEAIGVSRRRFLKMLGVAGGGAALSSLIAACGDDDDDDDDGGAAVATSAPDAAATTAGGGEATAPAGDAATTTSGGATGTATPKVLVAASGQDISNLDPHIGHDYSIASTQKSVYDTLLRYQGNPPELENLLATSYEPNEDASEWTVTLDERAVFHDGTPVKASDVVYSAGRLIRKNKGPAWMFVNVMEEGSAVAVDDQTVTFTLTTPFAPFPLILPWLFIVNEKVVKENEVDGDEGEAWLLDHEAGSGPFTIERWQVGDAYEFKAVEDYWWGWPEEGRLAGYIWKISRESSSTRLMLLNGDAHIGFDLSSEDAEALRQEPSLKVNDERGFSVFAVKMNNQRGPTSDINVRKAISYAMDYEAIIEALNGHAVLLEGPLPSNLGDFHNPNLELYRHDMDKAAAALAEAAAEYASGGFELEYVYVTGLQIEEQIGLILLDKLSQLDITLNIVPMVWPDMVARAQEVDTCPDMMAVYSGTTYADPDNFLWQAYHSSQAGFWAAASHYMNPEFDKVLEDARATPDHAKRVELYHRAQEMLVADAVEIFGQSEIGRATWTTKLGGYRVTPIMGYYFQPMYLMD